MESYGKIIVLRGLGLIWAAPCENISSGICGQQRSRSACISTQSDQGLHCPSTESLDAKNVSEKGEQMPR